MGELIEFWLYCKQGNKQVDRRCGNVSRKTTYCVAVHWFCNADVDEEQFEDNPEEYIRRDIEGSGKTRFQSSHVQGVLLFADTPSIGLLVVHHQLDCL